MVVIFDTNVLLDLFVFNDFRALHLKQALINGEIDALATPATLEEFTEVIARPLFSLDKVRQEQILFQWRSLARVLDDQSLLKSPWVCPDPDDQVFLDLAFTVKPCILISKDNEVLRFAGKAAAEHILITADYRSLIDNIDMSKPKMADHDNGLFKLGSKLRHIKSGGFYRVVFLANVEATLEPAYVYESMQSHDFWIRPKTQMEDGRFELISE